ncbi:MAG: DUF4150 domain-containing protein [Desulfovibrio sp.]|nr:DUF4150 domain-containing protein [Desulfovibrio sp.]
MFAATNSNGTFTANTPDVCKTPTPAGPTPVPYPNIAQATTTNPSSACKKVMVAGGLALNIGSKTMISNGDEAGTAGGVASNKFIGEAAFVQGSMKVSLEGKGAVRLGDPTTHNAKNTMGVVAAPSQSKVQMS